MLRNDTEFPYLKAGSGHVTHLLGTGKAEEKTPQPDAGELVRSWRNHPVYFPENECVMCL